MWWYDWNRDTDFDQIAGSLIAGHLIECTSYACGGYYSGFKNLFDGCENLGFPIAEIYADGSCLIEKEPGTGGEVCERPGFDDQTDDQGVCWNRLVPAFVRDTRPAVLWL